MIDNLTDYPHAGFVVRDEQARDRLIVVVKQTFQLSTGVPVLGAALRPADIGLTDQLMEGGALAVPADLVPVKPSTDIICHGTAHAPGGEPTQRMDVTLRIGALARTLAITGERRWVKCGDTVVPSEPEPFVRMPLGFAWAFGGRDDSGSYMANPVGRGLPAVEGGRLPSVEDPEHLITGPDDRPAPAAFGAVAPSWDPRRGLAGTYDDNWRRTRAPLLPADFDPRFYQAAPKDLVYLGFVRGGETVELSGMVPGSKRFVAEVPRTRVRVLLASRWRVPVIDTLLIEPDVDRLVLTLKTSLDVTTWGDAVPRVRVVERRRVKLGGQDQLASPEGAPRLMIRRGALSPRGSIS